MLKQVLQLSAAAAVLCCTQTQAFAAQPAQKPAVVVAQDNGSDTKEADASESAPADQKPALLASNEDQSGDQQDGQPKTTEQPAVTKLAADEGQESSTEVKGDEATKKALVKKTDLFAACCTPEAIDALKKEREEKRRLNGEEAPKSDEKPVPATPERLA